jgi:hypothetical protein
VALDKITTYGSLNNSEQVVALIDEVSFYLQFCFIKNRRKFNFFNKFFFN